MYKHILTLYEFLALWYVFWGSLAFIIYCNVIIYRNWKEGRL